MQTTSTQSRTPRLVTIALIALTLGVGALAASPEAAAARDPLLEEVAENKARTGGEHCHTEQPLLVDPEALRSGVSRTAS